jgi:hypothetical protein
MSLDAARTSAYATCPTVTISVRQATICGSGRTLNSAVSPRPATFERANSPKFFASVCDAFENHDLWRGLLIAPKQ